MRVFLPILFATLMFADAFAATVNDSLRAVLREEIGRSSVYIEKRQSQISALQSAAETTQDDNQRYALNAAVFEESSHFDSYVAYKALMDNVSLAGKIGNEQKRQESMLMLADYAGSLGLYYEGHLLIENVNRAALQGENLRLYYRAIYDLYSEMSGYTQQQELKDSYRGVSNCYGDSLLAALEQADYPAYLELVEMRSVFNTPEKALEMNVARMQGMDESSQEYCTAAYYRAFAYFLLDEMPSAEEWFLRSAIADVRRGVTDNGSIWMLADMAMKKGDISLAYFYVDYGKDNSAKFNAPMRRAQMAIMQSVISKDYETRLSAKAQTLQNVLYAVVLLSLLLVAGIAVLLVLMRKLSVLQGVLKEKNEVLVRANEELQDKQRILSEANLVKEEYVKQFMLFISTYMEKREASRRKAAKLLALKKYSDLTKMVEGDVEKDTEAELQDFYKVFDESFQRMYPGFVEGFNKLLVPEARFKLQPGDRLPTELRIFALIRLGVTDSAQIAKFLRYSPNTIYNYRARVKNNALGDRSLFEKQVMDI